jgi:hypothetical protein
MLDGATLLQVLSAIGGPTAIVATYLLWKLDRRIFRLEMHLFGAKGEEP